MSSNDRSGRKFNWHHPFPAARFKNRVEIALHNAYNRVFLGHCTAWEAEKFLREKLAGPSGIISDKALSEEAREIQSYKRRKEKRQKLAAKKKTNGNGRKQKNPTLSYREAFELVFGTERWVDRCVEILKRHPWMPPGVTYRWDGDRVILIFDYAEMRRAQESRNDVIGLVPEFE